MRVTNECWLEAQYSVLGSALIESRVVPTIMSETTEDDYYGKCRSVYNAIRKVFLQGAPVDPVSVLAVLGKEYSSFLAQLMEITPTAANVVHYIQLCREQARVLMIRELAKQLEEADSSEEVRDLMEKANGLMVDRRSRRAVNMSEALRSFMDRHTGQVSYLSWPIREFNEHIFVEAGDFIIIGAEPSVGKTAFSLQCAWHWARDIKVGFFSFETSSEKLFDRKMASLVGVQMQNIKNNTITDQEWERICASTDEITTRKLELIPAAGMTTADIRAKIMEAGYQLVIVDYLQLISSRGYNRYEQVTNISIDLHNMAQSLGVTIVALSQLSRSDDDRAPKNSDLRESGQLEQDADLIMMLQLEKKNHPSGNRKLFVTKNKEGECFVSVLAFDGTHQTFSKTQSDGKVASQYAAMSRKKPQRTPVLSQNNEQLSFGSGELKRLPDDTPVPF